MKKNNPKKKKMMMKKKKKVLGAADRLVAEARPGQVSAASGRLVAFLA
eukprot:CAMPEP_0206491948 /NCGR_PEP_ID=MMETSP0324_2-20121206/45567_1 /ASSEMBLY_ACC=CAM_ASM_000836 /TAXON_ID=2866 /ORGANISM="Crypthecodinium cohnii, Strain Seligo" /LENGTH=47 /DNA_ID= /DNA_START= /DNA_END= /DNA_ORIENTATION=